MEKLKCFLYILMRNELPCGAVAKIMSEIPDDKVFVYSNKGLAEYADEIAQRLMK